MIEGEEIFESAQETGYRLCRSRENPTSEQVDLVFSANWDLNVPNRLHVCLQNGQLKVFNVESRTSERYNILFRRYTPVFEGNTQTEKLVSHHWDKMTTIPDRPDEIIFLMGISRTLMYTALPPPEDRPYPEMPLLASTARGDFPGFIFGSPVMEISSHHTRITSIAISPAGHILASGDESGNVRLLLLRLLDEISVFKQNERRRKKHTAATTFSQFLPTYNVTVPVHEGPVFSMQWLPILSSSQSNNVRNYALVTGSMDRSVRIWRVSCCSSKGISMTPAMVLDTLSTHVLSLNALFYTDRFALAKINRTEAFANRATRSLSRASSFSSMLSFGAGDFEFELPPAPNTSAANSIFLAAGTSVGTIYVWKLNFTDVQDAISPPPATDDKAGTGSADRRAVVSDDGTKLYSLLQTSDRPIIHVTLAAYPSASLPLSPGPSPGKEMTSGSGSGGDVVLAASDTQGAVHLYTPEKIVAHDGVGNPTKRQSRDLVELAHHPLYDEYRRKMSPLDAATQSLTPLVRVGEQSYPSAVVCCSFPPAYPNDDLAASPLSSPLNSPSSKSQAGMSGKTRLGKWDPAAMVQRNGPLLVGVAHGELYIYDSADLASLSTGQNKQLDKPLELEIVLEGGRRKSVSGAHVSDDHSDASEDSAVEASDRKTITRKNSMRERQQANATLAAAANAGGSDSDVCSQDEWENLKIAPKHVRYTAPVNATEVLPTKPAGSSFFADKKKAASAVVVEEDCSEYPRTKPPPAPVAAHVGPKSVNAGTKKPTPLNTSANKPAGNTGSRSVPVQEQHGASDDYDRTDLSVTTTASTPSSPLSTLPSPPKFVQNRIAAKAQQAPRVNSLATPVETFSKVDLDARSYSSLE